MKDILITCWKDDCAECSLFASLPAFFAAAQFARGNFDRADIERKFLARYGVAFETFLALDELDLSSGELANPSKYMLYSDPFFGILDRTAIGKDGAVYAQIRAKLALGAKNRTFGYIFRTLMSLCDVLEYKLTLGLRTREAYRTGDRAALDALIADYRTTETRVRAFYRAFRAQWDRECRENGFENHDIRLGGLVCRLRHCRTLLEEYRDGKRTRIPALEEDILPFGDAKDGQPVVYNDWLYLSIVKPRV